MKTLQRLLLPGLLLIAAVSCFAQLDTNALPGVIFQSLTNFCPTLAPDNLQGWTGDLAARVIPGTTNFDTLNSNLLKTFSSTDPLLSWLNWSSNSPSLTLAAAQIGSQEFPSAGVKPPQIPGLKRKDTASNSWGQVFLWTGAKLENPYTISSATKTLQAAGSSGSPYIEIGFAESYVMRSGKYNDLSWWPSDEETPDDHRARFLWPWSKVPDLTGDFGYVFSSSTGPSNYSASTVVGSSDIYGDGTLGFPFIRYCSEDFQWKQQATFDFSKGFVTDKQFDTVHPSLFAGLGYQGKFPNFVGTTNLPIYWLAHGGLGLIDRPVISGTNVVFSTAGGLSVPSFHERWVPTVGTVIIIPVNGALSLQAGGNAYFSDAPASWNITLGVSLDLSKFAKGLGTALGISQ